MDLFNTRYYKYYNYVLRLFGLCPHQWLPEKIITSIFFNVTIFSLIVAIAHGMTYDWGKDIATDLESLVMVLVIHDVFIEHTSLYWQSKKIEKLFARISEERKRLTNKVELKILNDYAKDGRNVIISTTYWAILYFTFAYFNFEPQFFKSSGTSINHTRSLSFPHYSRNLTLFEKFHLVQVCLHTTGITAFAGLGFFAILIIYISGVKHVCGLNAITRYRLQNASKLPKIPFQKVVPDSVVVFNLIKAVEKHNEAIMVTQLIRKIFDTGFLMFQFTTLIVIGISAFNLKYHDGNLHELLRTVPLLLGFMIYSFQINWAGQQIIQSSDEIFLAAYGIDWYTLSVRARIIVLMMMRRTTKPDLLTAGHGVVVLSYQNFMLMLKAAWSVATILLTVQSKSSRNGLL